MLKLHELKKLKKSIGQSDVRLPEIFDALSDANRCQIFRTFVKQTNLCVSDVAQIMGLSTPLASQHMKILEARGLLVKEKLGRKVYYRVNERDDLVMAVVRAVL